MTLHMICKLTTPFNDKMAGLNTGKRDYKSIFHLFSAHSIAIEVNMERYSFVFYNPFRESSIAGSIPPLYREVYDTVCPGSSTRIPKALWLKVVGTGRIAESTAEEVSLFKHSTPYHWRKLECCMPPLLM